MIDRYLWMWLKVMALFITVPAIIWGLISLVNKLAAIYGDKVFAIIVFFSVTLWVAVTLQNAKDRANR